MMETDRNHDEPLPTHLTQNIFYIFEMFDSSAEMVMSEVRFGKAIWKSCMRQMLFVGCLAHFFVPYWIHACMCASVCACVCVCVHVCLCSLMMVVMLFSESLRSPVSFRSFLSVLPLFPPPLARRYRHLPPLLDCTHGAWLLVCSL